MKAKVLLGAVVVITLALASNAAVFIENFDGYAPGSNMAGQGGWEGWDGDVAAGAPVSADYAFSGGQSVKITGSSDLVRPFSGISSGSWTVRLKQYVPVGATLGTNYLIFLNQYRDGAARDQYNWSVETEVQLDKGKIMSSYGGGSADLVRGAWVEYRLEVNLDSGTVEEFYNGQSLGAYLWQDGTGVNVLRAANLYSENPSPVYYDDLVVTPAPGTGQDLRLRAVMQLSDELGIPASSMFNPRYFDGDVYVDQVNAGATAFGRFPSGWPIPSMTVNNAATGPEHRMVAPFRGSYNRTYIIGSGSGAASLTTMSRYDFNGSNRVDYTTPFNMIVEGFDWVDKDTIIGTIYTSGNRKRLHLFDVVAEPFSLTLNTTWNADGYITSAVSTRIRNVRVGDVYSGYAYYGDGNVNSNPNFYALNLATGAETLLGNAGTLTGTGSYGVWTVLERDGLLYVQTTDNGIQIYTMTSGKTLGPLLATYAKDELDLVTSYTGQYYGLDVAPGGKTLLLAGTGKVFEFGPPQLNLALGIGTDLTVSWPAVVNDVLIQSSANVSGPFADVTPQPVPAVDGKLNKASVSPTGTQGFFRLRKGP